MLAQTPALIQAIDAALKKYHDTIYGDKITEDNWSTDPAAKELKARTEAAQDIGNAITDFVQNTVFIVVPGTLQTVGSPTNHANVTTGTINKI